jgi:hypothetical protein
MTGFNRRTLLAMIVIASIWTFGAKAATAQAGAPPTSSPAATSAKAPAQDSVSVKDVQKAAEELAIAVREAVRKATEDPAVKVAALQVARNAITTAQIVISQQAETLQSVLDSLAKEIAQAGERKQPKSGNH